MIAGLVIAIGAALIVSAFVGGGARWLVLPALIVAIPLGFVAAAGIDVDGGVGDRDYRPTSLDRAARTATGLASASCGSTCATSTCPPATRR